MPLNCHRNELSLSAARPRRSSADRRGQRGCSAALWFLIFIVSPPGVGLVAGQSITFSQPSAQLRVNVSARQLYKWQQGQWDVYHASGNVNVSQGHLTLNSDQAVLWVDRVPVDQVTNVILYLEDSVVVTLGRVGPPHLATGKASDQFTDDVWLGRMRTLAGVQVDGFIEQISIDVAPEIFARASRRRQSELEAVEQVAYVQPQQPNELSVISPLTGQVQQVAPPPAPVPLSTIPGSSGPAPQTTLPVNPPPQTSGGSATTNVQILPRNPSIGGSVKVEVGSLPGERVLISTGGARVNIDSRELAAISQYGQPRTSRLVIQADNVVAWENPVLNPDGTTGSRYEVYLEGNVIFAMGRRVIYADRMYYDAQNRRGTILNADLLTPIPQYRGLVRLKADVVQQLNDNQWQAYGAALTSSRLGVPRYWLQSNQVSLTRQDRPTFDPVTGRQLIDPQTGQPPTGEDYFAESRNNVIYLANVPVFYWPVLRTNLSNPSYYVERIRVGNDNIFGNQFGVGLDMFQVLGIRNPPENTQWIGILDYLQKRGLGFGTDIDYQADSFLGIAGQVDGYARGWFINDSGLDNLGRDRRAVPLAEEFRGRFLLRHRHTFAPGYQFRGELGWLSDNNFLQQYYEREWDQDKDYTTGIWLERNVRSQSFNLIADAQVNDFFTQTEWLPRFDHFILGQPLLFDRAVWHGHSTIGYGRFRTADPPTNPIDLAKFDPLAWETVAGGVTGARTEGVVAGTRQELDFPFQLGAVNVVPYLLGDASYWQQDLAGDDLFRVYGQTGLRTSLPFWSVDPTIHSTLLNLNGLAHKITFDSEFLYADASQNLDRLPLYNPLDDDAQEFFRRRFAFDTFGIIGGAGENAPLRFDERFFAHRYGMQSYVTSPAMEIADDLMVVRSGVRNRWQTKRGLPGEARVIDWVTLDVQGSWFPRASRDNFGADFGLLEYDFRWYIGDRLSLVSDGFMDFFSQGMRTASIGAHASRPGVGNVFVGFRTIEGPISSNVLNASLTYRMSDKWIVRGGSSIDFGSTGNIGQSLSFVRIGESFLIRLGVNADASRGNIGFVFGFEPRFLPQGRLGLVGGRRIPPASTDYLE